MQLCNYQGQVQGHFIIKVNPKELSRHRLTMLYNYQRQFQRHLVNKVNIEEANITVDLISNIIRY